jgi:ketosteroid isomerase-like protein
VSTKADDHRELIRRFYESFQKRDAEGMVACYADDVSFTDPVFQTLVGPKAGAMWRMLMSNPKSDLRVEFRDVVADDRRGSAHWDAYYTFNTGRFVHNSIDATFEFRDGKIAKHVDTFDLHAWAGQALGLAGKLFGGFGFFQKKVRSMAQKRLADSVANGGKAP